MIPLYFLLLSASVLTEPTAETASGPVKAGCRFGEARESTANYKEDGISPKSRGTQKLSSQSVTNFPSVDHPSTALSIQKTDFLTPAEVWASYAERGKVKPFSEPSIIPSNSAGYRLSHQHDGDY